MTVRGLARTNWMMWSLNRIWIWTPRRITIHRFRMMLMQMLGLRLQMLEAVTQILLVMGMLNEIIQAPSQSLPLVFGTESRVTTPQMWNLTIVTPLDYQAAAV